MRHARHKVVLFGLLQELGSQVVSQMGCDDTRCKVSQRVEKEDGDGKGEHDGSCRARTRNDGKRAAKHAGDIDLGRNRRAEHDGAHEHGLQSSADDNALLDIAKDQADKQARKQRTTKHRNAKCLLVHRRHNATSATRRYWAAILINPRNKPAGETFRTARLQATAAI